MKKKLFAFPTVFLSGMETGENPDPGLGTGQGTPDEDIGWDWENWMVIYDELDLDGNEIPGEWGDYVAWWQSHEGWTEDMFREANGGRGYADAP